MIEYWEEPLLIGQAIVSFIQDRDDFTLPSFSMHWVSRKCLTRRLGHHYCSCCSHNRSLVDHRNIHLGSRLHIMDLTAEQPWKLFLLRAFTCTTVQGTAHIRKHRNDGRSDLSHHLIRRQTPQRPNPWSIVILALYLDIYSYIEAQVKVFHIRGQVILSHSC